MKIRLKENLSTNIIILFYMLTVMILILDKSNSLPIANVLRKFKYVYLLFAIFYCLKCSKGCFHKKVLIFVGLFMLHTVLFGKVFVNYDLLVLTNEHFREMMIHIALVFFTYYFVWCEGLYKEFIQCSFWASALSLIWVAVTNISSFVNPLYFVYVFAGKHTYRTTFGFGHANSAGNIFMYVLIYSIILLDILRGKDKIIKLFKSKQALAILAVDFIIVMMLFSTQSRTSIIGLLLFVVLYIIFQWESILDVSVNVRNLIIGIIIVAVILFVVSGGVSSVWSESNREENINVNYPIFKQYNPWIGMGYVAPSGFYMDVYGHNTFPVDIFYLYVFFTTGYIGSLIIGSLLIYTLIVLLKKFKQGNKVPLAFYAAMLFTGIGQTNMLVYTIPTGIINISLILLFISDYKKSIELEGVDYEKIF